MRKVLITGTSQGSGFTVAKRFLKEGFEVIGMDVLPAPEEILCNLHFTFYQIDVGDKTALPELQDIDYIIVNAATQDEPKCVKSNIYGYLNVCEKYAFNDGVKSVLFMGSISAIAGIDLPMYCLSKGANRSYAKNLAMRLAPKGVLVNMLTLGPTETPMNDVFLNDKKLYDDVASQNLLHKWISPDEVADWVYFLLVVNKSATGAEFICDCGETAHYTFITDEETKKKYFSSRFDDIV